MLLMIRSLIDLLSVNLSEDRSLLLTISMILPAFLFILRSFSEEESSREMVLLLTMISLAFLMEMVVSSYKFI